MHEDRIKRAQEAPPEELWKLLRSDYSDILPYAVLNSSLNEEMAVYIAKKRHIPAEVLGHLANDIRFRDSYKLKLAICRNPKTPQKITLSLIKFLRIFDLGDLTRDQHIAISIRQKIEHVLIEKIPSMPSGNMIALSKRANSTIVLALMGKGDRKVIQECLDSPSLTEGDIFRAITRADIKPMLVRTIAVHPKWSLRYHLKLALVRNYHTPMLQVSNFISELKTSDLKELYNDEHVSLSTKPFLFRELRDRGVTAETEDEEIYELQDENDTPDNR